MGWDHGMTLVRCPAQSRFQPGQVAQGFIPLNPRIQSQDGGDTTLLDNFFFPLKFNYNSLCCNLCLMPLTYHNAINNVNY